MEAFADGVQAALGGATPATPRVPEVRVGWCITPDRRTCVCTVWMRIGRVAPYGGVRLARLAAPTHRAVQLTAAQGDAWCRRVVRPRLHAVWDANLTGGDERAVAAALGKVGGAGWTPPVWASSIVVDVGNDGI